MTIPRSNSRLTLVRAPRVAGDDHVVVRRYRLARLELNGRRPDDGHVHSHLKRVYD